MQPGHTRVVVNSAETPTAEFIKNPNWRFPGASAEADIRKLNDRLEERVAERTRELEKANSTLRQTQLAIMQHERLRALGQMASGIAHDINNAISPIALYTESLLEREPGLSDRARNYLTTIQRAIEDVAETVARMSQVPGNLGGMFKETAISRQATDDLRRAQAEAEIRCF